MDIKFLSHVRLHLAGENATHPIARFSGRLAALLFVAGSGHAPRARRGQAVAVKPLKRQQPRSRALPDNPKTAHSDTSNYGF